MFTGEGEPISYAANEDDRVMIDRNTAKRLGSLDAILDHFNAADVEMPPLVIEAQLF